MRHGFEGFLFIPIIMKTPHEVFRETLKDLGFENHKPSEMSNSDYHLCTITAMYNFAKLSCDEQIESCYKSADIHFDESGFMDGYIRTDCVAIDKYSILNTPNVVTIKNQ